MQDRPENYNKKHKKATVKLQRFYRRYLQKKRTVFRLPDAQLQNGQKKSSTGAINSFLVGKLTATDGLYAAVAGKKTLMASLNAGNYDLLEYYFQHGIDPRGFIYDAYFRGTGPYAASLELLDAICDIKAAADELTEKAVPGKKVRCYAIFKDNGEYTRHAHKYLLPYLRRIFSFTQQDETTLRSMLTTIPKAEQFFTAVDINKELQLAAIKMVIKICLHFIKTNKTLSLYSTLSNAADLLCSNANPYKTELKSMLDAVIRNGGILISDISYVLNYVYAELIKQYPNLHKHTTRSNFYLQLVYSSTALMYPVTARKGKAAAQILTPGSILALCHRISYGEQNELERIIAYGKFDESDIAKFTRQNGRLINTPDNNVAGLTVAHGAACRPWSLRIHDILHWHRMYSVPVSIRMGIASWASMLEKETGLEVPKLAFQFYDMDFTSYENMSRHDERRTKLTDNLSALIYYYKIMMKDATSQDKFGLVDYHLLLTFEMLRDPSWMNRVFSHCTDQFPANYLDYFLSNLCTAFKNADEYHHIKRIFNPRHTTTHNVFRYLLFKAVRNQTLDSWRADIMLFCAEIVDICKWTMANGLALSHNSQTVFARHLNWREFETVLSMFHNAASTDARQKLRLHLQKRLAVVSRNNNSHEGHELVYIIDKFFPEIMAHRHISQHTQESTRPTAPSQQGFFTRTKNMLKERLAGSSTKAKEYRKITDTAQPPQTPGAVKRMLPRR